MNKGLSAAEAGSMHGSLQLATAIPGLILAATLRRMNDQRLAAVVVSLLSAIAFAGFAFAPKFALLWSLILGFGCGASMMLGLTFIVLRTNTTEDAAVLSGMSQCIGYLMAASGPLLFGKLFDFFSDWTVPLLMTSIIAVLGAFSGILAGRNKHIEHKGSLN
ncbi:2-nitroimidazole transporter [compost metagenome]